MGAAQLPDGTHMMTWRHLSRTNLTSKTLPVYRTTHTYTGVHTHHNHRSQDSSLGSQWIFNHLRRTPSDVQSERTRHSRTYSAASPFPECQHQQVLLNKLYCEHELLKLGPMQPNTGSPHYESLAHWKPNRLQCTQDTEASALAVQKAAFSPRIKAVAGITVVKFIFCINSPVQQQLPTILKHVK